MVRPEVRSPQTVAPGAGLVSFVNHIWPGFWDPTINGTEAFIAITIAFAWKYIGYNFITTFFVLKMSFDVTQIILECFISILFHCFLSCELRLSVRSSGVIGIVVF